MYRYDIISASQENPGERRLVALTAETVAIKLQMDSVPERHFIQETPYGHVRFACRIDGYCAVSGRYICIHRGLGPKLTVATVIHEMRHAYQWQNPKRHKLSRGMRERDAEIFVREFFGTHSDSGDAAALTDTLNRILNDELDRLWKRACATVRARLSAERAQLSTPSGIDESDAELRRPFEPIIRARSLAVQQFVDPNNSRLQFPAGIEFGSPCAGLKVSYQNKMI
jgi:hypothetical protein